MLLAGPAAVFVTCAIGQEATEDAMLGMKDGQMLVSNSLDIGGASIPRKVRHLRGVQIVPRREPRNQLEILGRGQRVRRIQTEVADQERMFLSPQRMQNSGGADENLAIQAQ